MSAFAESESVEPLEFGASLRTLRVQHGWSLRELSSRIRFHHGYIGRVEQGHKFPDRQFAELADRALDAHGALIGTWRGDADRREEAARTGRLLAASTRDSLRLISAAEQLIENGDLDRQVRRLAVAYLGSPPGPILVAAVELRGEALRRLQQHQYRPHELADLYLTIGRLQGILAYSALDLGDAESAMTHARAALACSERAGDAELGAWVRGTQSLIARFQGDYPQAEAHILSVSAFHGPGTGALRLLCGYAQCRSHFADSTATIRALDQAAEGREHLSTTDSMAGIFEFSQAKQLYYGGSSLIWLDGGTDAERAAREARAAIAIWEMEPPEARSLDDEALAHLYEATALLQLRDLDAAAAAIRPVLDLPAERQISWIGKRLSRFAAMLHSGGFASSPGAADLVDEIHAFAPAAGP
ncbi:transcriptional regulator with XRE-family HTH domain [Allocatelliglobosispora scoriae]|uniref:Transcriptional regulator with XRE-family HTH domain n=1 Tax=Allocatelliglobosispora scoriae TaxID=643052 RepID=A0A841BX00_9ACTN|nr:helix-turn-helix transcriptional regulator [Allocatelliglobosispora scoriae]MBB5873657.1 transcriptional regulator with XRE-family HTH domain [Allocatelliglobosispora scoriae]